MASIADGILMAWCVAIVGYALGMHLHAIMWLRYRRYCARALSRAVVERWLFDEARRFWADTMLVLWGLARLYLIYQRAPGLSEQPTVLSFDGLTLVLYWGLLILFKHWTWWAWRNRQREEAALARREALE